MAQFFGRRQDLFSVRDVGLNLSTTAGEVAVGGDDGGVQPGRAGPLGVFTKRDEPTFGRKAQAKAKKVTRYFPGQVPKWVKPDPVERHKVEPVVLKKEEDLDRVDGDVPDDDDDDDEGRRPGRRRRQSV
mmetsp:Transcript_25085/g.81108  ORF Transcript_25085/g.81108 Transcript_25085/m.81108 type:complete len:129 (+) Transcript_25085:780-1166(+)